MYIGLSGLERVTPENLGIENELLWFAMFLKIWNFCVTGLVSPQSSLLLPNHNITTITRDDLAGYEGLLEHLTIVNGTLKSIVDGTFVMMESLLTLDLHNTRIRAINPNTFIGERNEQFELGASIVTNIRKGKSRYHCTIDKPDFGLRDYGHVNI